MLLNYLNRTKIPLQNFTLNFLLNVFSMRSVSSSKNAIRLKGSVLFYQHCNIVGFATVIFGLLTHSHLPLVYDIYA